MSRVIDTVRKWNKGISEHGRPAPKQIVVMQDPFESNRRPERLGQPLQYTEEMNFLDQRRICSDRLLRSQDTSRFYWYQYPELRKQQREGWERECRIVMACLQKNDDDMRLYEEMRRRFRLAMRQRGTKERVKKLIEVFYWGLDQIEAIMKRQPIVRDFDIPPEDIEDRYYKLQEEAEEYQ